MKITSNRVVADEVKDTEADLRKCASCDGQVFFVPQKVMVLSPSGARAMRLWTCEIHPLPDVITDSPED